MLKSTTTVPCGSISAGGPRAQLGQTGPVANRLSSTSLRHSTNARQLSAIRRRRVCKSCQSSLRFLLRDGITKLWQRRGSCLAERIDPVQMRSLPTLLSAVKVARQTPKANKEDMTCYRYPKATSVISAKRPGSIFASPIKFSAV